MANKEEQPKVDETKKAKRLLPIHLGGESEASPSSREEDQEETLTAEKRYENRAEMLSEAPDLESVLRGHLETKGQASPEGINLSLAAIEEFQRYVHEAQDLREIVKKATDPNEKIKALAVYNAKKEQIQEYLNIGKSFESAYREYIRSRNKYIHFKTSLKEIAKLTKLLNEPSFKSLEEDANLDERSYARVEALMREKKNESDAEGDQAITLEAIKTIYTEGSEEYEALVRQLDVVPEVDSLQTKRDILDEITKLREEIEEFWSDSMVRYFSGVSELEGIMTDYHKGEAVLETQSSVKYLNMIHEWEQIHQRTTIGGVLVGPPGVGKTTLVRHYLKAMGRSCTYIDLSEDVTRYLLYGSKSIEFKNPTEFYTTLSSNLDRLKSEEDIKRFVSENVKTLSTVFGVKGDEATVVFLEQLQESLAKGTTAEGLSKDIAERVQGVLIKIKNLVEQTFRKELASEFAHVVKRNGWRDGVVIDALRRGESIIFDEFNKNKNWSLLYSLMEAEPGKDWKFADNLNEPIRIPDNWRMYFTANIGRRHGGFAVAEALASRAKGKVIEIEYPTAREELLVALTAMSNPEGDFLRSNEDLAKLFVLIHDVFPGMRKYLADKPQTIPVSFRTIRDIAEKLVLSRDPKSKKLVYQVTDKSFDEALYEVLISSYALYEDKEPAREWASTLTSLGLLLDDKVKDKVIKLIGEVEFEERRKKFEGMKDDFQQVVAKIKGMTRGMGADMAIPDQTNF